MNLVLIGYRGCGKSTVGRELSKRLDWGFIDTDVVIQQRTGMTIRELFSDRAEQGFRDLESQVIAEVAELDRHVISTGGGVVLRSENVDNLRRCGRIVYLTASPEILWRRIFDDAQRHSTRLRMSPHTGLDLVRQTLEERVPLYRQSADVVIDTTQRSVDSLLNELIPRVRSLTP